MKKLVVFDLDGTLAESKSSIDGEMAALLRSLLEVVKVAVISGGDWPQFEQQLLAHLPQADLRNLSLLPTCGTKFYVYGDGGTSFQAFADGSQWKQLYAETFKADEKEKIISALKHVMQSPAFKVERVWGEVIEDRQTQITYSALGQQAPLEAKKKWDPDFKKRLAMKVLLEELIPEFYVRLGGTTSVDITRPGIDKAYGIRKLRDTLGVAIEEMIFVGDALFPGGNDYPARQAGAHCIEVRDPNESKRIIEAFIACLS